MLRSKSDFKTIPIDFLGMKSIAGGERVPWLSAVAFLDHLEVGKGLYIAEGELAVAVTLA